MVLLEVALKGILRLLILTNSSKADCILKCEGRVKYAVAPAVYVSILNG